MKKFQFQTYSEKQEILLKNLSSFTEEIPSSKYYGKEKLLSFPELEKIILNYNVSVVLTPVFTFNFDFMSFDKRENFEKVNYMSWGDSFSMEVKSFLFETFEELIEEFKSENYYFIYHCFVDRDEKYKISFAKFSEDSIRGFIELFESKERLKYMSNLSSDKAIEYVNSEQFLFDKKLVNVTNTQELYKYFSESCGIKVPF